MQPLQTHSIPADGGWLYVAELIHRVGNEYTTAVSSVRLAAARASSIEAKKALDEVVGRISAFAVAHRVMQAPTTPGLVDLGDHLIRLCTAVTVASLEERRISLTLEVFTPVIMDVYRSWRVGLIVGELITNASRHAFAAEGGAIRVTIALVSGQVACEVSDDGESAATVSPGVGTWLVDSLAAELGGHLQRRFGPKGASVRLLLPQFPINVRAQS